MPLTESTVRPCPVDLVSADHFWVVTMAAAISHRLRLKVFSFVVGVITQPIQKGESLPGDREGDLCTELNIATSLATDNRSDMSLAEADDAIGDASAVSVIENGLLTDKLTDHQKLLVDMPPGSQEAGSAGCQGINAREVSLQVAELLLDGLAYLVDTGSLLLGHSKKLLPRQFAVRARLMAKAFSDLRMHRINQDLGHLPRFIEQ